MRLRTHLVRRELSAPEMALAVVAAIAVLYLAKPIAVPLALALLLTFILAPVVAAFERLGIPRVYAVAVTTMLALSLVGGVGWLVGHETRLLVTELPNHKEQIRAKLERLKGSSEGAFG